MKNKEKCLWSLLNVIALWFKTKVIDHVLGNFVQVLGRGNGRSWEKIGKQREMFMVCVKGDGKPTQSNCDDFSALQLRVNETL